MGFPKLVITDIDGVWTDGGMFYDETSLELKKFNTSDSVGVLFLRYLDIPLAIMTGENTDIVRRRARKLKIEHAHLGIKDKVACAESLLSQFDVSWEDVAFIGDDINDLPLLKKVGFSAVPANAPDYVKSEVDLVLKTRGGDGAFREFVEYLVNTHGSIEPLLERYFEERRLEQ